MLRFILLFSLMTTAAFANQTECYLDNNLEDGTYGFFLQDESITLMKPFNKFMELERNGAELLNQGEVVGKLKMFFPRGVMTMGDEMSSFKCTVWHTGGRG